MKKCSAKDCCISRNLNQDLTFFKFPRDLDRCSTWVKNAGNEKLLLVPSKRLHVRRYLCADHFAENQFFDKFRRRLRRTAIPTLFSCPPLSVEEMSKFPVDDTESSINQNMDEMGTCSTINILSNKYNSFPLHYPKESSADYFHRSCHKEAKDEDSFSVIKIPCKSSSHGLNPPVPGSITYIVGPWSDHSKEEESISIHTIDASGRWKNKSENDVSDIHHVDLCDAESKGFFSEQSTQHMFKVNSCSPTNTQFFHETVPVSEQALSGMENHLLTSPHSEKHFILQNRFLTNGAQVQVICSVPEK